MRKQIGFTLIEMMITLVIMVIVLRVAVPSFQTTFANNRLLTQANEIANSIQYARSEAIKRTATVTICSSANPTAVAPVTPACAGSTTWTTGWIVFSDTDGDAVVDAGETLLRVFDGSTAGNTITTTAASSIIFLSTGLRTTGALDVVLTVANTGCKGNFKRTVTVNAIGRSSVAKLNC